jgi:hypothetical protein
VCRFRHAFADQLAQFVHRQARRVDRQVGGIVEGREQPAFLLQGLLQAHRRRGSADAGAVSR